ncbi:unnamed protein product [Closterium sp. NIES-53]
MPPAGVHVDGGHPVGALGAAVGHEEIRKQRRPSLLFAISLPSHVFLFPPPSSHVPMMQGTAEGVTRGAKQTCMGQAKRTVTEKEAEGEREREREGEREREREREGGGESLSSQLRGALASSGVTL